LVDIGSALRTFLLANSALYALTGNRIWTEVDTPPPGYTPADGGAVCVKVRGGKPENSDLLLYASLQCKCYGATQVAANAVYRALYGALHNTRAGGIIRWGQSEVLGQTLREPDTTGGSPWWFVLAFFEVYVATDGG